MSVHLPLVWKKSEPTDIMGSCDQGRIKLSTQFLNFSVTINHLCLEQCFLFTSKQVPVDRLSISLSVLQHTHSRIQTWTASQREALPPSLSHKVNLPFVQLSFCDTDQQGSPKGPILRVSPVLGTAWINEQPSLHWACTINQHHWVLPTPAQVRCQGHSSALHILMAGEQSTGC